MNFKQKRGQVAVYVIIALVIVIAVAAIFLYSRIKPTAVEDVAASPEKYMESCLKPLIVDEIKARALHGGDIDPEAFILYKNQKIKYLCYTSDNYKTCVVQEPLIKERMEEKVSGSMQSEAEKCVVLLAQALENQGYSVSKTNTKADVMINPDKISVVVNSPMTVTKENSRNYQSFKFDIPSKYYEVLYIASSIVDYEATFGDSETTDYLRFYPDISIEKNQIDNSVTIYKITNFETNESFSFASRSLPWPPGGYAL